jgi:hypothetical protein
MALLVGRGRFIIHRQSASHRFSLPLGSHNGLNIYRPIKWKIDYRGMWGDDRNDRHPQAQRRRELRAVVASLEVGLGYRYGNTVGKTDSKASETLEFKTLSSLQTHRMFKDVSTMMMASGRGGR